MIGALDSACYATGWFAEKIPRQDESSQTDVLLEQIIAFSKGHS